MDSNEFEIYRHYAKRIYSRPLSSSVIEFQQESVHLVGGFHFIPNRRLSDPVKCPHGLLSYRSGLDKSHRRSRGCFADGFRINKIVLVTFNEGADKFMRYPLSVFCRLWGWLLLSLIPDKPVTLLKQWVT